MRLEHVDLFILHGLLVPDDAPAGLGTPRALWLAAVRPALQRLVEEGLAGAWGITGIGVPDALLATLAEDPAPGAIQCVANLLDSPGAMQRFDDDPRPRALIAAAQERGVGVMGIRAVQAGALTDAIDRPLPDDHPERRDFARAAPFRALAAELGKTPAALAHRYALDMAGVDTLVLGVKNRAELRECLAAEAAGPLEPELVARIDAAVR
jgi:aryl-alcohol dehydrogenase-like predicted oxidoreductase